jgi:hypothetical protein
MPDLSRACCSDPVLSLLEHRILILLFSSLCLLKTFPHLADVFFLTGYHYCWCFRVGSS